MTNLCIPVDQNFVGLSISDGYIGNENFFMFDEPPNKAKRKEKVVHSERFDWLLLYINSGIQFYQESSFSSRICCVLCTPSLKIHKAFRTTIPC